MATRQASANTAGKATKAASGAKGAKGAKAEPAKAYDWRTVLDAAVSDLKAAESAFANADLARRPIEWTIGRLAYQATQAEGVKASDVYAMIARIVSESVKSTKLAEERNVSQAAQAYRVFADTMSSESVWTMAVWAGAHSHYVKAHPTATRADYVREVKAQRAAHGHRPATTHAKGRPAWYPEGKPRGAPKATASDGAAPESSARKSAESAQVVVYQVTLTGTVLTAYRRWCAKQAESGSDYAAMADGDRLVSLLKSALGA